MTIESTDSPGFRPLYRQVHDLLRRRIAQGHWRPDDPLPSEGRLAVELGVSQGTVRKALDDLARENLVVRRQGRGTFVAAHSVERSLFHFFMLCGDEGERRLPTSRLLDCRRGLAGEAERARLGLPEGASVLRIDRLRLLGERPAIVERVVLPAALFPDLGNGGEAIPNTLYDLYQRRFGVTVARATERLKAVAATSDEAEQLSVVPGAPLLEIDRLALDLDGRPVEWRLSRCLTDEVHYASVLE
ncbi:MAG: GntR family transcriptional regulator [Azospirillaceae bacterium]